MQMFSDYKWTLLNRQGIILKIQKEFYIAFPWQSLLYS